MISICEKEKIQTQISSRINGEKIVLTEQEINVLKGSTNTFHKSILENHEKYGKITFNQYVYIHEFIQSSLKGNLLSKAIPEFAVKTADSDFYNYWFFRIFCQGSISKTQNHNAKVLKININKETNEAELFLMLFAEDEDLKFVDKKETEKTKIDAYEQKSASLSISRSIKERDIDLELEVMNMSHSDPDLRRIGDVTEFIIDYNRKTKSEGSINWNVKNIKNILKREVFAIVRVFIPIPTNTDVFSLLGKELKVNLYNASAFCDYQSKRLVKAVKSVSYGYSFRPIYQEVSFPFVNLTKNNKFF